MFYETRYALVAFVTKYKWPLICAGIGLMVLAVMANAS